jgi:hypothetical protein
MFLTTSEFKQPIPEGLKTHDLQHWVATVLSNHLPWYLATYRLSSKKGYHVQTATIAWETVLCDWLKAVHRESVVAINFMAWSNVSFEWTTKRIEAMWHASKSEVHITGPLVFRLSGEPELWCSNDVPVVGESRKRRLLVRIPPAQDQPGRSKRARKTSVARGGAAD